LVVKQIFASQKVFLWEKKMQNKKLKQERLKEILHYNPEAWSRRKPTLCKALV
jgi:hypothetical protein